MGDDKKNKKSDKKDKKSDKKDKESDKEDKETPEGKEKRKEKIDNEKSDKKEKETPEEKAERKEKEKSDKKDKETPEEKAERKEKSVKKDKESNKKDKETPEEKAERKEKGEYLKDNEKREKKNNEQNSPLVFKPTCDIFDQYENSARVPVVSWRNLGGKQQFCGQAVTVQCFGDNSRVKELVATPGNNCVMVVDGGASMRHALMGDQLADIAATNNWAGIIVYGCVRDVAVLAKIPLGVLAIGTTPRKSVRRGEGQVDLTIRIGDVVVQPGDHVYADEDGVLILSPADVEAGSSK